MLYQIKSKILLVDDEPTFRELYRDLFEEYGWWVLTADSFESAKHLLDDHYFHASTLDIRLVDHEEHNEQGMHLLSQIYDSGEPTGVIIITGFPTNERYRAAFLPAIEQKRQVDFLEKKNLDDDKLVESLTTAYMFAQNELDEKRKNLTIKDLEVKTNLSELGKQITREPFNYAEEILVYFAKILYPIKFIEDTEKVDHSKDFPIFSITFWSKMFGSAHTIKIGFRKAILDEKMQLEEKNIKAKIETKGSISGIMYPES